jgi:hypothetical protein
LAQKPHFKEKKTARQVKKHVKYLADDDLAGRLTGTAGETKSAEYIAKQFEKIGLTPFGNFKYLQNMTVPNMRMAQGNSSLMLDGKVLTLFSEHYPISLSSNNGSYKGEAINVGYGIEDPGLKTTNYKGKDVKGKTVIINIDIPGGANEHNRFVSWDDLEFRIDYAKSKGVKAVIFYSADAKLAPTGTLAKVIDNSNIPVIFVKKDLSEKETYNVDLNIDILLLSTESYNVLGYIDNGAKSTVVIGAHHDHLGSGSKGGSLSETDGEIHNGADDNASGVSALIELAKTVKNSKYYKNNNYIFAAFTGGEQEQQGSKYFIDKAFENKLGEKISYMVNLDMIGHLDSTKKVLMINGIGTSPDWNKAIKKVSYPKRKIATVKTTESGIGSSDHTSFYKNEIPAIHFTTGYHQHFHKPTDDAGIINYGGEAFVISYISRFLCEMDKISENSQTAIKQGEVYKLNPNGKIEFTKTDGLGYTNFNPISGILPDYTFEGEGLLVDGVKSNMPADVAGLLKGDIVTALNGRKIQNIQDFMKVMDSINKGDKISFRIKRENETKERYVQF